MNARAAMLATGATLFALAFPAHAEVQAYFSAGATCEGPSHASFSPGGGDVVVSLCAATTAENVCGTSILLDTTANGHDRFRVMQRTLGPAFPDPNTEQLGAAVPVSSSGRKVDFGGTVNARDAFARPGRLLLATFSLAPQSHATEASYVISLGDHSSLVASLGDCAGKVLDVPIHAAFTLSRGGASTAVQQR